MAWRVAKSLLTLREQVDAMAPNRNKSSDGTIGDQSHRSRNSDHNPNADGVAVAVARLQPLHEHYGDGVRWRGRFQQKRL
jgi:hypothetical protein